MSGDPSRHAATVRFIRQGSEPTKALDRLKVGVAGCEVCRTAADFARAERAAKESVGGLAIEVTDAKRILDATVRAYDAIRLGCHPMTPRAEELRDRLLTSV